MHFVTCLFFALRAIELVRPAPLPAANPTRPTSPAPCTPCAAEERRLAHVACTRAKSLHIISYPSTVQDGRGRQLAARRSKFLDEMLCTLEEGRGMAGVVELRAGG